MTITDYRYFDLFIACASERYRTFEVNALAGKASIPFHHSLSQPNPRRHP